MDSIASSSSEPTKDSINTPKQKKFSKIPIFIVENHNEVLELILPALANYYLPFENNLMVHFDSHPDLCVARDLPTKAVFDRNLLLQSLSIENWIIPLLYMNSVNEVVWIHEKFCNQIPVGEHEFSVGEFEDTIRVSSTTDYFLTDGSFVEESLLKTRKKVKLHSIQLSESIHDIIDEKSWILDIDLDYFSTLNPFLSLYPKANTHEKLKEIFKMEKDYDQSDIESMRRFVSRRNEELDFFDSVFQFMAQNGSLEKFKCENESMKEKLELVKQLVESLCHHYSIYDIDWFLVNDCGATTDSEEYQLPHHESTDAEIGEMMKKFETFLAGCKKNPEMVTISRSCEDGYCPKHQIEKIQNLVLQSLQKVFGEKIASPTYWYKSGSLGISALELVEPRKKILSSSS
jgi:hypothetical protein